MDTSTRRWNWPLWAGFLLSLAAFSSYFLLFAKFPITRDIPWANFLLFAVALVLLIAGMRRAFASSAVYRGKILGPVLTTASLAVMGFFLFVVLGGTKLKQLSTGAPRAGQTAPDFTLMDTNGKPVSLSAMLADLKTAPTESGKPPPTILLVFYRGYW